MKRLLDRIAGTSVFSEIYQRYIHGSVFSVGGGISEKTLLSACLAEKEKLPCVFIVSDELKAQTYRAEFENCFPGDVIYLPPRELLLYNVEARSHDNEHERIKALCRILKGNYRALIIPVRALADIMCSPENLIRASFKISNNDQLTIQQLAGKIAEAGYKRESLVEGKGQFSVRGGIIDIFPVNHDYPARIEYFGDDIDSVRLFDPASQRSFENIETFEFYPASEALPDSQSRSALAAQLSEKYSGKPEYAEDIARLGQDLPIYGADRYASLIAGEKRSILEYAGQYVLCVDNADAFDSNYGAVIYESVQEASRLLEKGLIHAGMTDVANDLAYTQLLISRQKQVCLSAFQMPGNEESVYISSRPIPSAHGDMGILRETLDALSAKKTDIFFAISDNDRADRLRELLGDAGPYTRIQGGISGSFEMPSEKLAVFSEAALLGQTQKRRERGFKGQNTKKISAFTDIRAGEYVVHRVHGIGIYEGIAQLTVEGVKRDYIRIGYRDGGSLYIPTEQLDAIQKYIGSDDRKVRVNKLGSGEWTRIKSRVKESLIKLAEELVELYSLRQNIQGHAFSRDSSWQKEFEDKFPHDETEDQLTCVDEIKTDMERPVPMDRILCGDVGYGKTEVAIRAMFKAVSDSRQVAYLVPTTVLAQQQYQNFIERFADYPIRIEMLSRFRTPQQQKEIVKKTKRGAIDILIATHRMLSADIEFKNLGLLVVDEEHRFGVRHKEKLKEKHPYIDVLTLTATPIPRTLHMSMVGIRDISVIEMPPRERYPIQTYVMEYDTEIIRNAISRELARGGQVFYIHNRVRDIELARDRLHKLVPGARIDISHGQMGERELEKVMEDFQNRESDILLCTSIIESGLDISNANTIIIEDAENFGLAQLYQIKGRVGRSDRHAYAYITYKKDRILNENAEKRLEAIREFTEFGAGFKIALRDLEIRGAGNLLGAEQHGQMDAVGYEMYCRLLEEAIADAKGLKTRRSSEEFKLEIRISAYIDDKFITDMEQKLDLYKRIAEIASEEDMSELFDELADRYGDVPRETENLLKLSYIKYLAVETGFSGIKQERDSAVFRYASKDDVDLQTIAKLGAEFRNRILFTPTANPYITLKLTDREDRSVLDNIKILLQVAYKLK